MSYSFHPYLRIGIDEKCDFGLAKDFNEFVKNELIVLRPVPTVIGSKVAVGDNVHVAVVFAQEQVAKRIEPGAQCGIVGGIDQQRRQAYERRI